MIKFFTNQLRNFSINNKYKNYSSILDFGSGNGAFILYLIYKFNLKNNYSIELSKKLLLSQKKIIKKTKFICINNNYNTLFFKQISDNIVDLNVIGGEPTLIPEFYELFEFCEEQNTNIFLSRLFIGFFFGGFDRFLDCYGKLG